MIDDDDLPFGSTNLIYLHDKDYWLTDGRTD